MSNPSATDVELDSAAKMALAAAVRHAATAGAGFLVAKGVIASDGAGGMADWLAAGMLGAAAYGWSLAQKAFVRARLNAAAGASRDA